MKISVVLHNIRSVYNVGAILRTCEGLGIERVVYSGYTPVYDDQKLLPHLRAKLNRQIEKSALGAEKLVRQERCGEMGDSNASVNLADASSDADSKSVCKTLLTFLDKCAIMGYRIVGLENNLTSDEAKRRVILGEKKDFGTDKIVLILGEEVHGIPAEIRQKCEYFLEIPMQGQKESFNVSVAAGIALWGLSNLY